MDVKTALFFDIDNTLIHSHRRKKDGDICVEWLNGQEQSFMTQTAYALFQECAERLRMIPVTTRSREQYQRIRWPGNWMPDDALVANGGVLLHGGEVDLPWQLESQEEARPYQKALLELLQIVQKTEGFSLCRMVDDLFLFAKRETGLAEFPTLPAGIEMHQVGQKIYYFPPGLDKGSAVLRFQKHRQISHVICAGDSPIDIPMLRIADLAFAPHADLLQTSEQPDLRICPPDKNYAEFILEQVFTRDVAPAPPHGGPIPRDPLLPFS